MTLVDNLKSLSYDRLEHNYFFFVHRNKIVISIYLDDLLLFETDLAGIGQLKKYLSDTFCMIDIGAIS